MTAFGPITIPMPASMNATAKYRESRDMLESELGAWEGTKLDRKARLELRVAFHWADNRRKRDLLNYDKLMVDVLCKVLGIDDSQFDRVILERGEHRTPPEVEIEIGEWV